MVALWSPEYVVFLFWVAAEEKDCIKMQYTIKDNGKFLCSDAVLALQGQPQTESRKIQESSDDNSRD